MEKTNESSESLSRLDYSFQQVDDLNPQDVQDRLKTIDMALRLRFSDYSPDVEALAPLSAVLDLATLDDVFAKACRADTFQEFCESVKQIWNAYTTRIERERVAPKIILAQIFNNHVATVLGERGKITTQFLEMSVRRISPELADQLDFKNAKSEPTVFVFGNNVSRICDLLFTIPYKDGRSGGFPLIVLLEHKSAPDKYVVEQMLVSLVATLDFVRRYPERFRTPDGKMIWPFVVLFYTGAQRWDHIQNLPELFTTSLEKLDQKWIFNLKFLLVSLIDKRLDVVPSTGEEVDASTARTLDEALRSTDNWLQSFFELLRRAELLVKNSSATREGWFKDVGAVLHTLKNVYNLNDAQDRVALDHILSFTGTMCAKMNFEIPTHDELTTIMANEGIGGMIATSRLIYASEREAGKREGRREGKLEGKLEGKQELLAKAISYRFPMAPTSFISDTLKPFSDSYADELLIASMDAGSFEDFQKKAKALAPVSK